MTIAPVETVRAGEALKVREPRSVDHHYRLRGLRHPHLNTRCPRFGARVLPRVQVTPSKDSRQICAADGAEAKAPFTEVGSESERYDELFERRGERRPLVP